MEPTLRDVPEQERFELVVDDEVAGFIDYTVAGKRIVLRHTEIDQAREGQGLGGKLAEAAFDLIAERELEVVPTCPFIAKWLHRHPERVAQVTPALRSQFPSGG